jgi:uncharacterized membrane protein
MAQVEKIGFRETSTEENVYAGVYRVLVGGMVVSTLFFAVGVIRALIHPTFMPLTPEWVRQHYHVSSVMQGLATFDPISLMMVATILLILTPVVRVLVSIWAFMVDHDYKYVGITSIVFLIMVVTVIAGLLGLH